jgi:hypothetical protein
MDKRFRTSTANGAVVEFGLVRHALLAKVAAGTIRYEDVCDAHPELLRAAKNLGRKTGETCPVCSDVELVEVTYVFGARLPSGGTCPTTRAELLKLERREEPVQCYAVEVCVGCSFHHLVRKWSSDDERPGDPGSKTTKWRNSPGHGDRLRRAGGPIGLGRWRRSDTRG